MAKIQFLSSWDSAKEDKTVFNDWCRKAITTKRACRLIAENNRLDYISEEDFIETATSLGYRQGMFMYDDDDED